MENIVYNELILRGYNVDVGVVDVYDKDKEEKQTQELNSLRNIPDSFKKIVIMGMKYFLLNADSLEF